MTKVHGVCRVNIITDGPELDGSPMGKPFLQLTFEETGLVVNITTNLAEMIGGAGGGARQRYEDNLKGAN